MDLSLFDELTAVEKIGLNYLVQQEMANEAAKRNRAALGRTDALLSSATKRLSRFETNSRSLLDEVDKLAPATEDAPEDAPEAEPVCKSVQEVIEQAQTLAAQNLKPEALRAGLMKIRLEKPVDTPRSLDDVMKAAAFIAKTKQGDDLKQSLLRLR